MILVKTDAGQQVFKDRSVRLTPRQRTAFILFDGKRSVQDVIDSGMGVGAEEIQQMVELGLLGPAVGAVPVVHAAAPNLMAAPRVAEASAPFRPQAQSPAAAPPESGAAQPSAPGPTDTRSAQQRYKDAYPIATQLTGALGLRGFRLNLSVEGTSNLDDLLALLPKIQAAVGREKTAALERALGV